MIVSEPVLRWLEQRRPAPPQALLERMAEALGVVADSVPVGVAGAAGAVGLGAAGDAVPPIPAALGTAALDRLRVVLAAPNDRAAALDLLAADALLTYAFEAAAEIGPDALESTARAFGPGRLADLLPGTS